MSTVDQQMERFLAQAPRRSASVMRKEDILEPVAGLKHRDEWRRVEVVGDMTEGNAREILRLLAIWDVAEWYVFIGDWRGAGGWLGCGFAKERIWIGSRDRDERGWSDRYALQEAENADQDDLARLLIEPLTAEKMRVVLDPIYRCSLEQRFRPLQEKVEGWRSLVCANGAIRSLLVSFDDDGEFRVTTS